jgi:hypothetical protein
MRITLTRSGGVAGIRLNLCVDSKELNERDAAQLSKLLAAANLHELARTPTQARTPDAFCYTLTTEDGGEQAFHFGEDAPDAVGALCAWLRKKARQHNPKS